MITVTVVEPPTAASPQLTVAVCTRNRPEDLTDCVRSVLANPGDDFELLVVDQSDSAASDALGELSQDRRLRYHVSRARGLSRARNEVLELARGSLVAFTDDDCRVGPSWVADVQRYFARRPDVALAFGRVVAPAELHQKGYVATFEPAEATFVERFPSPLEPWGIGACMVMKHDLSQQIGAFDPELGAGAAIPAGEELDFTMRVIGAGLAIATTSAFEVTHLGVREHEAARKLFLGYVQGAGAAYAKNIRLATPGSKRLFARWCAGVSQQVLRAALSGRRPLGVGILLAGLRGGLDALAMPLNKKTRSFEKLA